MSLKFYLHPDSQFSDVSLLSGFLIVGIRPVSVKPSSNLGGEAITGCGGDGKSTVISGNVEWVAPHRAFGLLGSSGDIQRQTKVALKLYLF
jgi:hypothetical protein